MTKRFIDHYAVGRKRAAEAKQSPRYLGRSLVDWWQETGRKQTAKREKHYAGTPHRWDVYHEFHAGAWDEWHNVDALYAAHHWNAQDIYDADSALTEPQASMSAARYEADKRLSSFVIRRLRLR